MYPGQLLEINVVGCKNLKDTEWLSKQDPYVIIDYASTRVRTKTDTDGGKNPSFNEKFTIPLIEGLRELNVQVWNSNTLSLDDLIGNGKVHIDKVLSSGYDDSSWPLMSKSGKHAGELRLIMHYNHSKTGDKASKGHGTAYPSPSGYPPQHGAPGGYPPQHGAPAGYPPQHSGYPPQHSGYPPQEAHGYGYPPPPPPQQHGFGYPPQQHTAPPPAPPGYPASGYPPAGYPPHAGSSSKPAAVPYGSPAPPVVPAGYPSIHHAVPDKHHGVPDKHHGVPGKHHGGPDKHHGDYSHGKEKHGKYKKGKGKKDKGGWKGFKKVFK